MAAEDHYIELFEAHYEDLLPADIRADFEARLLVDSALAVEYETYKKLRVGLKDLQKEKVREQLKVLDDEIESKNPVRLYSKWRIWIFWPVAALVAAIFFLLPTVHRQVDLTVLPYEPGLPVTMHSASEQLGFANAMTHFKAGHFEVAAQLFDGVVSKFSSNDTLLFYLGNSLLRSGEYERSAQVFSQLCVQKNSAYKSHAEFYLWVSEYESTQSSEATRELSRIAERPQHPMQKAASYYLRHRVK